MLLQMNMALIDFQRYTFETEVLIYFNSICLLHQGEAEIELK